MRGTTLDEANSGHNRESLKMMAAAALFGATLEITSITAQVPDDKP